jgi:hypothetical protein
MERSNPTKNMMPLLVEWLNLSKQILILQKIHFFLPGASQLVRAELLLDKENGTREQKINHPT